MINIGMREIVVLWGRKWANEAFSLWQKPRILAPAQSGIAIPKFVDNCVFRVDVCGKSPRRLLEPINIINDTGMSDHVLPFGEGISIVSLIKSLTSHCWNEWERVRPVVWRRL